MTTNQAVLNWIEEIKTLARPSNEIWIDGTEKQLETLRKFACESEIITPLDKKTLPGCFFHRTSVGDAARATKRTFVCSQNKEDTIPSNNWSEPSEMYAKLHEMFKGSMEGKTMYVVPFYLGTGKYKRAGIEITDSIYVVLNLTMLAKCGKTAVTLLNNLPSKNTQSGVRVQTNETVLDSDSEPKFKKDWLCGIHSSGDGIPPIEDNRYICLFPEDNTVWSLNTGYGASAFLTKEMFSLRLASIQARDENWLAEHMAILEIETPHSETTYIAVAFPSGCGKTSLAMLNLPESYKEKGYNVRFVSEDVAWLNKGEDGRLWAINPETGIFGLLPGLSAEKKPNVYSALQKNAIFTNAVHNIDNNTVWWEGLELSEEEKEALTDESLLNWKGESWILPDDPIPEEEISLENDYELDADTFSDNEDDFNDNDNIGKDDDDNSVDEELDYDNKKPDDTKVSDDTLENSALGKIKQSIRGAHSNSRFTASLSNCPNLSEACNDKSNGVPISAIIFGGRRSKAMPLVFQSFDWEHGVFVGSALGTETGAGSITNPTVRREPMAMQGLCGYNMADYFEHWLKIGKKLGRKAPKIFSVNWFRDGDSNKLAWPGYGENIRVLDWIIKRINTPKPSEDTKDSKVTVPRLSISEVPVGYIPKAEDIDIEGLEEYGVTLETIENLLRIDKAHLKEDVNGVKQFYAKFGNRLPEKLREQLIDFERRLLNH
ncbi:MAG: phosphoenolpyruvate carboxykinase (GTP) [Oscillospiraceae bacterium]|nr:phosphoenolpyruvate carboxykinase (GTP) [Oscillospiraceae bacterium]